MILRFVKSKAKVCNLKTNQQSYDGRMTVICDRSFKCEIFVSGKCSEYMQLQRFNCVD